MVVIVEFAASNDITRLLGIIFSPEQMSSICIIRLQDASQTKDEDRKSQSEPGSLFSMRRRNTSTDRTHRDKAEMRDLSMRTAHQIKMSLVFGLRQAFTASVLAECLSYWSKYLLFPVYKLFMNWKRARRASVITAFNPCICIGVIIFACWLFSFYVTSPLREAPHLLYGAVWQEKN